MDFFGHFLSKFHFKYGHAVFFRKFYFLFLVTKNQMCLIGSITSKNRGEGSDPLRKNSITNPHFLQMASLSGATSRTEPKYHVTGPNNLRKDTFVLVNIVKLLGQNFVHAAATLQCHLASPHTVCSLNLETVIFVIFCQIRL